ncbi:hypothetical protein Tco_0242210 [Tanacetum coccineum]
MPSFTIKWLFSQFKDLLVSCHRFNIFSKWIVHVEKESRSPKNQSINNSIVFFNHKVEDCHHTPVGVPGALHSQKACDVRESSVMGKERSSRIWYYARANGKDLSGWLPSLSFIHASFLRQFLGFNLGRGGGLVVALFKIASRSRSGPPQVPDKFGSIQMKVGSSSRARNESASLIK